MEWGSTAVPSDTQAYHMTAYTFVTSRNQVVSLLTLIMLLCLFCCNVVPVLLYWSTMDRLHTRRRERSVRRLETLV